MGHRPAVAMPYNFLTNSLMKPLKNQVREKAATPETSGVVSLGSTMKYSRAMPPTDTPKNSTKVIGESTSKGLGSDSDRGSEEYSIPECDTLPTYGLLFADSCSFM